ncbi:putative membrane associated regulator, GGDEF family protein [Aliivibrio wodanis]|uniref:diguanylate cyclase n=1 Tax=Aliivibrio wodanis TaxID=80852 RepID=A0A090I5P3_9GAMM|nr:putative membrane associated regulator, GGDEF family protein [Aliivibrio wodanis]VVV06566.1 putative signaling protein [Aliivibrio wodanis]
MKNGSAFFYSSMVIGLLLFFLSIFYVYDSYKSDHDRINARLHFNASFVELWLIKSFSDSERALEDMVADLSRNGPNKKEDNPSAYQVEIAYLAEKEDVLPNAISAFIIDENCLITHNRIIHNVDVSHREYCRVLKKELEKERVVTLPFVDLLGRDVVVQGHKLKSDDGEFSGMVGFSTSLKFFNSTLRHLDLPPSMGIAILSSNLRLLSVVPKGGDSIGKTIDSSNIEPYILDKLHANNEVSFASDIYKNGNTDTVYARKVEGLPFIVVVTKQQDYWQTMISISLLSVIGICFVIMLLLIFNLHYVKRTKAQKEKYSELAYNDYLTGVNNRRAVEIKVGEALERYNASKQPFTVIMCDIDNFKEYNDQYGHHIGDLMITAFTDGCILNLEDGEIVGRFGGDEFIILLPNKNQQQAKVIAEKLQKVIRRISVPVGEKRLTMTCSMGISAVTDTTYTVQDIFSHADRQLYKAKESGRDCIGCH